MCILAVDGDANALRDLREKLCTAFPEEVIAAFDNPLNALKFGTQNQVSLLFTDVRLRPFDGYELIRALRQKQTFRAYVVSGTREQPDHLEWMNVSGCFTKPVPLEELQNIRR